MATPVTSTTTAAVRARAGRSSRACNRCYSKKVRCDGLEPCEHCRLASSACTYRAQKKRGPPKGCPPRGGIKKRGTGEGVADRKRGSSSASSSSVALPAAVPASLPSSLLKQQQQQPPLLSPLPHPKPAHNLDSFAALAESTDRISRQELEGKEWRMEGRHLVRQHSSVPTHSLPRSLVDSLIDIYLAFIHPHWPIIYLPVFSSLHALEREEPILFLAVLSIAAATFDQAVDQGHRCSQDDVCSLSSLKTSNELIESVRWHVLQNKLQRKISTVQALILVSLVDLGFGRSSQAYQYGGIACRMALDLGLHEADFDRVPHSKIQEGLRVVWACYILDKIISAILQRPIMMRREDLDVPFPDTMERDEFDLWLSGAARRFVVGGVYPRLEHAKVHSLSSFQAWADVMYIMEQILFNVYSRRAKQERKEEDSRHYDQTLAHLNNELQNWRASLPPQLQWSNDHLGVGPHVLTLRAWYFACILLLNRPRVPRLEEKRGKDSQGGQKSGADICRGAATEICCILEAYEETFRVRKIPSSWVYLIFQAATIHSSFSASHMSTVEQHLSPARQESIYRLDQCIHWLNRIAKTWTSASHHVETLKGLEHASAITRPPSPSANTPRLLEYPLETSSSPSGQEAGNAAWQAFWSDMPASSEDVSLWESFSVIFSQ